ncbi:right-handed parallel beta-helix repeat-containing protein [Cellulophaga sp. F20128]|uniref:right-handed parallel beta-helix repeat-containing protein n=1 Tax=Cellulophaga sp. F20128 TaxID=2926413 RepID=UPI001FF28E72|nr:right-handed parallel beta-helix repeat-containing protein [Cellulophaga sp. F20128]MCK0157050.1 right-handed parallel beta-helix repeat-containing protein [Cellulophaga sp. F20128]
MKTIITRLFLFATMVILGSCNTQKELFVANTGSDTSGDGSFKAPFATLERAREEIKILKKENATIGFVVQIRGGTYYRTTSFELNEEDSGTQKHPIIYKGYNNENVSIHGGVKIEIAKAEKIKDAAVLQRFDPSIADKIVVIDLSTLNLNDLGTMRPVGFSRPYGPAWAELFVNSKPFQLARWPNNATIPMGEVLDTGSVPRDGDFGGKGATFKFDTDRPTLWKNKKDIWISGYFFRGWAEDAVELAEIDTINKVFKTKGPSMYGFGSGLKFQRWYVYNILEEVDEPGEYYIDRTTKKLYFYPSEDIKVLELSVLEKPLVSIKGASNIELSGLQFECSRGMGVYMERTQNNRIQDCTFKNLGIVGVSIGKGIAPFKNLSHEGDGVAVSDKIGSYLQHVYANPVFNREAGNNNGVINCTIYNTGAGGIHLSGGDRLTLEPGNNYVENTTIHDFNRLEKSYRAGIDISGVGNRISNCEVYNAPSMAILMRGNDHLFEYNEIHNVCQEVHDQGALYYGRDPSERGHIVRYNYFHHLNSPHATSAVYHDDGACGMEVYGNIFYKPGNIPVLIGGGQDNPYTNNIFIDAELGIHIDNRNQGWSKFLLDKGGIYDQRLKMVNLKTPPYSTRYPNLVNYWEDEPALPKRNPVSKNIFYKVTTPIDGSKDWLPFLEDNWITEEDPGFVDIENGDFMLKETAKAFEKVPGFKAIPFDKIGVNKNRK